MFFSLFSFCRRASVGACRARILAAKVLGERHPIMASYCTELGSLYRECGNHARAVQMHERALVLLDSSVRAVASQNQHGPGSSAVTVSTDHTAWLADALTLQRVASEPVRLAIARAYFCLADALALSGRMDKAFDIATKVCGRGGCGAALHVVLGCCFAVLVACLVFVRF